MSPSVEELLQENERLETDNQALRAHRAELEAQLAGLTRPLDEARRAGKRQAAPFCKGEPRSDPKRPGRKAGDTHGHRLTMSKRRTRRPGRTPAPAVAAPSPRARSLPSTRPRSRAGPSCAGSTSTSATAGTAAGVCTVGTPCRPATPWAPPPSRWGRMPRRRWPACRRASLVRLGFHQCHAARLRQPPPPAAGPTHNPLHNDRQSFPHAARQERLRGP